MSRALRIAQISPLFESVPPKLYGGTERVVSLLTEELVQLGHDVTLFASGDSLTSARHVSIGKQALRLAKCRETLAPHMTMLAKVRAMSGEFDLIHFHTEYMHFDFAKHLEIPHVTTLHGRLDYAEYRDLFSFYRQLPLVSISHQQARPVSFANFVATVHHGLDLERLAFHSRGGDYLAFLGRISPEKGVEHAIEIARRTGMRLKIAAKIEELDGEYFEKIKPSLSEPFVEFVGEIGDRDKSEFLGEAFATLFPITWPEPFGLVMIESLATGTPVIAFRNGSVPEIVQHGQTGFIVDDVEGACDAIRNIHRIKRRSCRIDVEERFSARRMAAEYVKVYHRLLIEKAAHCATDETNDAIRAPMSPRDHGRNHLGLPRRLS